MEFVKEFAVFLHKNNAIKFGDFTLSSGKKSSYYIDLRVVPSFPHHFRKMIKRLEGMILDDLSLDGFDYIASVPTGGLVIASALAIETVKPLVYVRTNQKDHGTSKLVEGIMKTNAKVLMVDDVATTGGSVAKAIEELKKENVEINHAYVIVDRMQGADKLLASRGTKLHSLTNILEITQVLHKEGLVNDDILSKVKDHIDS